LTTTAQQGVFWPMGEKYFYTVKGVRQAPTTLDELKLLAARDELKRSDLVWTEGMAAWQPAGSTAEIFQGLPPDLEPGMIANTPTAATPPPLPAVTSSPLPATSMANPAQLDSIFSWYVYVLKKYADFDGRASKREFWTFFFVNLAIQFVLWFIEEIVFGAPGGLRAFYSLAVFTPFVGVGVRRMHDTDRTGWWVLLPIGNIIFWAEDSKPGTNRFGPNPKTVTP